ncbi:MAG: hypothetical protein ACTSSG_04160 [Candidatus Heimdallarchaeaceae archaeon]
MSEEKPKIEIYCKFCQKETLQEFVGENRKESFTITFYCPACGSYHVFEFFGSQFEQPTELE